MTVRRIEVGAEDDARVRFAREDVLGHVVALVHGRSRTAWKPRARCVIRAVSLTAGSIHSASGRAATVRLSCALNTMPKIAMNASGKHEQAHEHARIAAQEQQLFLDRGPASRVSQTAPGEREEDSLEVGVARSHLRDPRARASIAAITAAPLAVAISSWSTESVRVTPAACAAASSVASSPSSSS